MIAAVLTLAGLAATTLRNAPRTHMQLLHAFGGSRLCYKRERERFEAIENVT